MRTPAGVHGNKKVDVLLMPTRGGRLEIPRFSLPIFNPNKKAYETLTTDTLRVFVVGEPDVADNVAAPKTATDKASLQPLRVGISTDLAPAAPWTEPIWWVGLGAPWLLLVAVFAGRRMRRAFQRETPERRRKAVSKDARRRLAEARSQLDEGNTAGAYTAFSEAVLDLGSERFGVELRGLTLEEVDALLSENGAPASLVGPLLDELKTADFARFAPGALEGRSPEQLEQRWTRILGALENLTLKEEGS